MALGKARIPSPQVEISRSELGEPIHKVATRTVKLWKEFDDTVFKLPKERRGLRLAEGKEEIIGKLNRTLQNLGLDGRRTVALLSISAI